MEYLIVILTASMIATYALIVGRLLPKAYSESDTPASK